MKLHQQFDLNSKIFKDVGKSLLSMTPAKIEVLVRDLAQKGYTVLKSTSYVMGIPQSITIIKDSTDQAIATFTEKIKDDFSNIARKLGIDKLFE